MDSSTSEKISPATAADEQAADDAFEQCGVHYRHGRWPAVLEAARETLALLERCGQTGRRVELLRWTTLAACETGRFDAALASANESCRLAEAAGEPAQLALSLVSLGICIERMGDPWQSHRLMEEARALVQGLDDPYAHFVILNNLCAAHIGAFYLLRDSAGADEVRRVLDSAADHARQALPLVERLDSNPFIAAIVEGNLGEALVHLGQLDEAERWLTQALRRTAGNAARGWRIRYSMGELVLARGNARDAARHLQALCEEMQDSGQANTLTRVHDALYRSWRALGDAPHALAHLERFDALERKRVLAQLQAQSRLFVTRVEAERARLEVQAERLRAAEFEADAQRDQLTGLGNRRHLDKHMPSLLAAARHKAGGLALALLDLDHFKRVNDRFGHAVGDRVLVQIAQVLRDNTRAGDLLVRLGGEEFLVVLADTPPQRALEVCERLRAQAQSQDWEAIAPGLSLTLSIGLASAPPHELPPLMQAADEALYRAKDGGRNRVVMSS